MIENFEEDSSISSWIIDYYFTEILFKQIDKYVQPKNIIGCYDMWMIYRTIQPELSMIKFWNLCKNKLKKIPNDNLIEKYNNYLNRCGLIDIIDLFHQCQFDSILQTIIFSIKNIQNNMDQLFFEYLLELPSTSCDTKMKLTTKENLLQFIDHKKSIIEQTNNSKNDLKYTLCTYLSLLLDTRNEHALIHCLLTSKHIAFKRETIVELQCENLTIYQVFLSFLQRQEFSSLQYELEKYYDDIKEFFHFIEQLQMIIEENQCSNEIFRKLLELICKQLRKNHDDSVIEELCQCFQTSGATLAGRRLLAYLCAKQTIDLPILNDQYDSPSDLSPYVHPQITHSNPIRKYRSLDLSIIHETSFESDSIINTEIDHKTIIKRQPLREIDINSFNIEEREIEYEKNPIIFTLISDGDKENLPVITKKRSLISTKNEPPNKKHKK